MKRRKTGEMGELLARVATPTTLIVTASLLLASVTFVGSAFSPLPAVAGKSAGVLAGSALAAAPGGELGSGGVGATDLASLPKEENAADDRGLYYTVYVVQPGDTATAIAEAHGVSVDSIISFNDIKNTRALRPGQYLKVPSMAGILATAKEGDTAESLAATYEIAASGIIEANGLLSETIPAGKIVFLPDATLPSFQLREINGDLFRWPVRGWITSRYGWRSDPFTGVRSYHDGLDIGVSLGTPVLAAMEGRVIETGYSSSFGNYVLLSHHSGWMSFYGHLNSVSVKAGQWVSQGQRVAYSGNTGYSTGPHLHFTVFKNGRTMNPTVVLH